MISDPNRAESLICILREEMKRQRELRAELITIGYDTISIKFRINEIRSRFGISKGKIIYRCWVIDCG